MVMIELKGLHTVRAKGRTYYYAWRGGPRIRGEPGTPAFQATYNEAIASRSAPDRTRISGLLTQYKSSTEWRNLAPTTRESWTPWLDRIGTYFGALRIVQFDRPEKIRPIIRRWRSKYAETPRAADIGMQVLSRLMSFAVDQGSIASNPCEGFRQLYEGSRAEIIWTEKDIAQLKAASVDGKPACSPEVAAAVDLAAHTGLRVSDLIRLAWSHVGDDLIVITTGKSRHRREAVIPLYDDLRAVLARIPKRSPTVLTNSRHKPWTRDGLGSSFNKAKIAAGLAERDLHFHDLRGTAATKFYIAGLSERVIAEIMAWEEDQVARIIRRYVSRTAATKAIIRQIEQAKRPVVTSEDAFLVSDAVSQNALDAQLAGGCVYFVHAKSSGRVKIGQALSALARMMELSTGSAEQLRLVAVIPGGRNEERYLHYWFRDQRIKGEWFSEDAVLMDLIAASNADSSLDWKAWLKRRSDVNVIRMEQR